MKYKQRKNWGRRFFKLLIFFICLKKRKKCLKKAENFWCIFFWSAFLQPPSPPPPPPPKKKKKKKNNAKKKTGFYLDNKYLSFINFDNFMVVKVSISTVLFLKQSKKIKNKNLPPAPIFAQNLDENLKTYLAEMVKILYKIWIQVLSLLAATFAVC